ncbi:MAG: GNAT family N-acetyltransferase [Firmicutes bacterium]|nr:GNAT family N-acetyltransferase [Bacillota bacterium]
MIRKAKRADIDGVVEIYDAIHESEEKGTVSVGWIRGVYPTRETALRALKRGDLFVYDDEGDILAAAVINQEQDEAYGKGSWDDEVPDEAVCVLHTLVVSPSCNHRGIGREFVAFYEDYAREHGWYELRMDTNEKNKRARAMYKKLSYREVDIVPTVFNGIRGVNLVLLEKNLREGEPAE